MVFENCTIGGLGKSTIHLAGQRVTINGIEIKGNGTVEIDGNGNVTVNGVRNSPLSKMAAFNPVFHIKGNVESISTQSGDIHVKGNVTEARSMSGNVTASGSIRFARTMSGDVRGKF